MNEYIETWKCQECGGTHFYWHFEAPDGTRLVAELPAIPAMGNLEEAKARAVREHEEMIKQWQ